MKLIRQILSYCLWALVACCLAFAYVRMLLGPKLVATNSLMEIYNWIHQYALVHMAALIGGLITLLFILFDVFFLKTKLQNNGKAIFFRFVSLLAITSFVALLHYFLEKVIDVI
ncbi:MAG: hypothetical protein H6579_09415 [Chitinophagales bacterium]|nr:hypothetical protein [Chitinophagales bacterium]